MSSIDLLKLDVSKHIEKKNELSYLSWAWAWDQALRADPGATFTVSTWTDDMGRAQCWMNINGTAMVWVTVNMLGKSRTCMLPVMNSKNEPISIEGRTFKDKYGREKTEKLDAFNVNTAIMRCMTKCLALFGLGLYIYAGEDLPFEEDKPEGAPEKKAPREPSADLQLFADAIRESVTICQNLAGLQSIWKANQTTLDQLHREEPDLFEQVKQTFAATRKELEKANG